MAFDKGGAGDGMEGAMPDFMREMLLESFKRMAPDEVESLKARLLKSMLARKPHDQVLVDAAVSLVSAARRHQAEPENVDVMSAFLHTVYAMTEMLGAMMDEHPTLFAAKLRQEAAAFARTVELAGRPGWS